MLTPLVAEAADDAQAPVAPASETARDPGYGFFANAPGAPSVTARRLCPCRRRRAVRAREAGAEDRPHCTRGRIVDAARFGREGRSVDQPDGRARHHAGNARADLPRPRRRAASAAFRRARLAGSQHARPAGSCHVDPHDPDVGGVQPLPAHAARPGRQARQEGRLRDGGRSDRARQGPGREDHRSAHAPGAQQLRPRHRNTGRTTRRGQVADRHDHAERLAPGRLDRDRGARRRPRSVAREAARKRRASAACTRTTR